MHVVSRIPLFVRRGFRIIGVLALTYTAAVVALMIFETHLIFFPMTYPEGDWRLPRASPIPGSPAITYEDCYFQAADGTPLHGWFCSTASGDRLPLSAVNTQLTLLWFHGNAGNITHRRPMIDTLLQLPVRIFIIDYRGYGKSGGNPSEQGIYLDARAAWDHLVQERRIPPNRIVLFGKSLGSAPAIELATHVRTAGLIIQSAFTSVPDMAAVHFPFVPRSLIRTRMNSVDRIGGLSCPKLFIHSREDEIVPFELGRRLFEAAAEPKVFYEVVGAHHNDTCLVGGAMYLEALRKFLASIP